MKKTLTIFLFLLITLYSYTQQVKDSGYFRSPLDIPLFLSGTFGELRASHFHSGIDLKTQGVIGHKILAAADGYVARIKIQSGGYGRTLYLHHPNGLATVYAHLDAFAPEIEKYVKDYQYSTQQYEIDIYPKKEQFQITKGEQIAISGNSGRSGGPHLHFEIRNTANQVPVNGLFYGFDIQDNIKPTMYNLCIYSIDSVTREYTINSIIDLNKQKGNVSLPDTLLVSKNCGFGIEAYDFTNNSANRCGLYRIELFVNNKKIFQSTVDEIPFNLTRYILSHVDHEQRVNEKRKIQKMFIDPGNYLNIYDTRVDNGLISLSDTSAQHATLIVSDAYMNQSQLDFHFRYAPDTSLSHFTDEGIYFLADYENTFDTTHVRLEATRHSFYTNFYFNYSLQQTSGDAISDIHSIHNETTAVHKRMKLWIKPKISLNEKQKEQALICFINDEGEKSGLSSTWDGDYLITHTRGFGKYSIELDTAAPNVLAQNITENANMQSKSRIELKITDELSGIAEYKGYIDGVWVLFEYDAKNDLIFYRFDKERIKSNTNHDLEVYVTDAMGNTGMLFTSFYY
jgi:murein DD-endopeptidase MepM/ murein hydrolase activator NlpD